MAGKDPKEYKKKLRSHGLPKLKATRDKQKDALQNLLQETDVLSDSQTFGRKTYLKDLGMAEAKLQLQAERYEAQHQQVQEMLAEQHRKDATPEEDATTELMADDDEYEPLLYDVQEMLLRLTKMREEYRIWAKGSEELDIKEREAEVAIKEAEAKKQQELAEAEVKKQQELNDVEVQRQKDLAQRELDMKAKELHLKAKELEQKDQEMQLKDREMKMRETAAAAGTPIVVPTSSSNGGKHVKLPKLEMIPFTGEIEAWPSFRDTFKSTFQGMDDLDKLKYLKSYVKGDAESSVKGFSDVAANFTLAWQKLEKDYGNEKAIIRSHVQAIKKLHLPDTTTRSLRQFLNGLETHVERLKALGIDPDADYSLWYDIEVIVTSASVLFFNQLDEKRLQRVPPPDWAVSVLIEILGDYVRKMEQLERVSQSSNEEAASYVKSDMEEFQVPYGVAESSAQSLATKTQRRNPDPRLCELCGKHLHASRCQCFRSLNQRIRRAEEIGLCKVCLKNHARRPCQAKDVLCYYCQRKGHHQAICYQKFKPREATAALANSSQQQEESGEEEEEESTPMQAYAAMAQEKKGTMSHTRPEKPVIFQLASVKLTSGNLRQEATALLDSGSDRCYVTEKLRRALNLTPTHTQRLMIYRVMGNEEPTEVFSPVVEFTMDLADGGATRIQANVLPHIMQKVPHQPVNQEQLRQQVGDLTMLAMPPPTENRLVDIDLLIGMDKYEFIVNGASKPLSTHENGNYLRESRLGILVSGDRRKETFLCSSAALHSCILEGQHHAQRNARKMKKKGPIGDDTRPKVAMSSICGTVRSHTEQCEVPEADVVLWRTPDSRSQCRIQLKTKKI